MRQASFLEQTRLALLNAPFDDGWGGAIDMVARATGSRAAHLVALGGPLLLPLNMFTGDDSDRAAEYFTDSALWGASNWRVSTTTKPMAIQHEAHYAAYRAVANTADYDDAVSDLDMGFGCQCALLMGEDHFLGLAMLRGSRDGPSSASTLRIFRLLTREVERSVRMQLALADERSAILLGELGGAKSPVILLDRHGQVVALSPAAEPAFEADGPFQIRGTGLALKNRHEDGHMQKAMARLLASRDNLVGPYLHVTNVGRSDASRGHRWKLSIVRLPPAACTLGFGAELALTITPDA